MDFFSLDSVFQEEGEKFWDMIAGDVSCNGDGDKTVSVPNRSAFRSYVRDNEQMMVSSSSSTVNVKRRMLDLLRKNWEEKKIVAVVPEKERCRRHMMKERTRREKQKQSYLALHSLLPLATKNDKNSIVEKAVDQIRKLEGLKKELERRMNVLEAKSGMHPDEMNGTNIKFNVQEPLSGIDSMVEILQSLKSMGTKLKTVEANFSPHEFSAIMKIETQIRGEEVEKGVHRRLQETEWKLLFLPEASFLRD
ncbi:Transcription factor bHLH92 [Hirschfeldia incana]|nr:Transcription factor bHLH92 [Hirschfeldia incana]